MSEISIFCIDKANLATLKSPAYYDMTDIPRYGICERAKITNFLVENCPTLQDYFKTMQPLIKVLTIRDHLESYYLSPI